MTTYNTESFMALDTQTQNNLELFRSSRSGKSEGSLLAVIDLTRTAMGGRLLRKWVGQPLLDITELTQRLDAVEWFYQDNLMRNRVISLFNDMADMERLINRIKANIASPRELAALKRGLEIVPKLKEILGGSPLDWLKENLKPQPDIVELITKSISRPTSCQPGRRRSYTTRFFS